MGNYGDVVMAAGPWAHWRMDDASPTQRNAMGDPTRDYPLDAAPSLTQGIAPGSTTALASGWAASSGVAGAWDSGSWSVEGWFRPSSWARYNRLFAKRASGSSSWMVQEGPSVGELHLYTSGSYYSLTPAGTVPVGSTSHVAVTADAATRTVVTYVNGARAGSVEAPTPPANTSARFAIGLASDGSGYPFVGVIDEVSVFTRALSAAEVATHYAADSSALPARGGWRYLPI